MSDFKAIALRLRSGCTYLHYLLVKEPDPQKGHTSTLETLRSSLFVCGIPLCLSIKHLREIFECFGEVVSLTVHHSQTSAIVVFESPEAKQAALNSATAGQIIEYDILISNQVYGLKGWVQAHKALTPGNDVLQKQLDEWMAAHEEAEKKRREALEAAMADDGWTVVVKSKGRKRSREEDGVSKVSGGISQNAAATLSQQKKATKHEDFYRFQKREHRRNELLDIQTKFEEDKKRVAELRAARNFRPF